MYLQHPKTALVVVAEEGEAGAVEIETEEDDSFSIQNIKRNSKFVHHSFLLLIAR